MRFSCSLGYKNPPSCLCDLYGPRDPWLAERNTVWWSRWKCVRVCYNYCPAGKSKFPREGVCCVSSDHHGWKYHISDHNTSYQGNTIFVSLVTVQSLDLYPGEMVISFIDKRMHLFKKEVQPSMSCSVWVTLSFTHSILFFPHFKH